MLTVMLRQGALTVVYPNGNQKTYGDGSGPPATVTVRTKRTLRRLLLNTELAVGESYMDEELVVQDDDLRSFFATTMANIADKNHTVWQAVLARARRALKRWKQANIIGTARRNVAHHYDLSGQFYDLFLDTDKQYSCAYFRSNDATLEKAQADKKAHIARKLRIAPGMRVLDIGCGWGGMGLTLARDYGAHVVGVTLSEEQHKIATERARAAGLEGQVDFRLQDYRHVTERFDRIVSVGMFEHVGVPHYGEYFGFVKQHLEDDGIALIHTIAKTGPPGYMDAWMEKYIFPGAYAPSLSEVAQAIDAQRLCVSDLEVLRIHYAETLAHWLARFEANVDRAEALYDARFVRMWRFYLASMEASFRYGKVLVHQYQLAKRNDVVPITRDYLYRQSEAKRGLAAE